jgi:hypothetical protein
LVDEEDLGTPVPPTPVPPLSEFRAKQLEEMVESQCRYVLATQLKRDEPLRKLGVGLVGAPNSVCGLGWKEFHVDPDADSISRLSEVKSAPPDVPIYVPEDQESVIPCGQGSPREVLSQEDMEYQIYQYEKEVVLPPSAQMDVGSYVDVTSHVVLSKEAPVVVQQGVNTGSPVKSPVAQPTKVSQVVDNKSFEERRTLAMVKTFLQNRRESEERRLDSRMESLLEARLISQQEIYTQKFEAFKSDQEKGQSKLQRSLDLLLSRQVPSAAQGVADKVAMPPPPPPQVVPPRPKIGRASCRERV